jgi:hypothetical protein
MTQATHAPPQPPCAPQPLQPTAPQEGGWDERDVPFCYGLPLAPSDPRPRSRCQWRGKRRRSRQGWRSERRR